MDYLPVFLNLKNKKILVIGGGDVAYRKIQLLIDAGADVFIVSKELCFNLEIFVKKKKIQWIAKKFRPEHILDKFLVIAATNNQDLNIQVYREAEKNNIFINVVDHPDLCSFIFPSIIDRSPIMIAISSGGKAPVLIKQIREKLEAILPLHIGKAAQIAGKWRNKVKQKIYSSIDRRNFWEKLFRSNFLFLANRGNESEAEKYLEDSLYNNYHKTEGRVVLLGAGPGDAELLTLKGLQILQQADVILYDNLVNRKILDISRRDAEKIFVGKKAGNHLMVQEKINNLMVMHANSGKLVVRLKGGDPFIFGRGGEELHFLQKNNILCEIIPGITSAIGASAYFKIPLTHRNVSKGVTFITGHNQEEEETLPWEAISHFNHTLVIYMGKMKAQFIQDILIHYKKDILTPIAVISKATCPDEKIFTGTLSHLAELADKSEFPSLLIIGDVIELYKLFNDS